MKHFFLSAVLILQASFSFLIPALAQSDVLLMRDVFAAMPDSVLPMVSKNNRLDCIDFIENQMEAKVRNALDEYVTLEALTSDYARFRTSNASLMEMKLLKQADSTLVLAVVRTVQMGESGTPQRMEDSNLTLFTTDWVRMSAPTVVARKTVESLGLESFVKAIEDGSATMKAIEEGSATITAPGATTESEANGAAQRRAETARTIAHFHPMSMHLSPDNASLTLTLQTAQLSKEEREAIAPLIKPVVLQWNGEIWQP